MAQIMVAAQAQNNLGHTPWGNAHVLRFTLETDAAGKVKNATGSTAAVAIGDKLVLGALPAGCLLADCQVVVSKAIAGLAGKLGFIYADGVDDAAQPQDAEYFGASVSLASVARVRSESTKAPAVLKKDAYLVLEATAAATGDGRADVLLTLAAHGTP